MLNCPIFFRRIKVPAIGIEGNYFPITSGAFIQDTRLRLTLLTTHAQGAASYEPGQLEVMLDRRTLYDDYRGMGEGVVDSRLTRHKFWILVEDIPGGQHVVQPPSYKVLSQQAQHLANTLRYPPNIYFVNSLEQPDLSVALLPLVKLLPKGALPCDVHLTTLRTLSDSELQLFPSGSALLVLHRQGFDCSVSAGAELGLEDVCPLSSKGLGNVQLGRLSLHTIEATSLTGTEQKASKESLHIRSLSEISLEPMELRTFNLTFRAEV